MNKNYLIYRDDVLKLIDLQYETYVEAGVAETVNKLMSYINRLSFIQQPTMSAIEYGEIKQRICKQYRYAPCENCPLYSGNTDCSLPIPHTVAIVEKWVLEHPEE